MMKTFILENLIPQYPIQNSKLWWNFQNCNFFINFPYRFGSRKIQFDMGKSTVLDFLAWIYHDYEYEITAHQA